MSAPRYNTHMPWDERPSHETRSRSAGWRCSAGRSKRARHRKGWSQRDLERRTGIDQSTISKFENGRRFGLRFTRFAAMVAVLDGLEFDAPGYPPEPPVLSRRAQRLYDEAELQASIARARRWDDGGRRGR